MTRIDLPDGVEHIVQSDNKGNVIGPIEKKHAHSEGVRATTTHWSTWSMIYHLSSGTYGLQLKNPKKHDKHTAGKWDMGAAGHNPYVKREEGYMPLGFGENLKKEAEEEIGINPRVVNELEDFVEAVKGQKEPVAFIFDQFHFKTETDNEWVGLGFIMAPTQDVEFTDGEVIDFKWLTPNELQTFIDTETNYCSPLPLVFEKAETFRKTYLT